jgi:hypothetical protein
MKRKETEPSGSVEEYVVSKRSIDEDRSAKRCGIEYTSSSSSGSEGLGDEVRTLWLLQNITTLEVDRAHLCGVKNGGAQVGKKERVHIYGVGIGKEEEVHSSGAYI